MSLRIEEKTMVLTKAHIEGNKEYAKENGLKAGDEVVIDRERVFTLECECGDKGGEIRFPENHGRESDAALERELKERYTHMCHTCCCKHRNDASHTEYGGGCKLGLHI